jgi:cell division protein ZapA (FtsZ GTPase activity inhibitor)
MKTKLLTVIFTILCIACSEKATQKTQFAGNEIPPLDKSLALKPPMGWNSWDCLGWDANEGEIRAAAEYMDKHLKHLGYEYIVIDMSKPGAQEYYNSVFELFADWGLDFVKADDMNDPDIIGMSRAMRRCGTPMGIT